PHWATLRPSPVRASMWAVLRLNPVVIVANQRATFSVSRVSGRDSFTLEYFSRVGSCHTCPLLPPSSRVSRTTSQPSPSQVLNDPSSMSSIVTTKQTLTAGSSGAGAVAMARASRSVTGVDEEAGAFAFEPQIGLEQPAEGC